jgi:small subunit ribosomal protein S16
MALVMRLRRQGARKRPFFRIVVAESSSPRDGRCVAQVGTYDPASDPPKVHLVADQVQRWLKAGARPSSTVANLIARAQEQPTAEAREQTVTA